MATNSVFFTLPLEIRRKIYRLLLAGVHTIGNASKLTKDRDLHMLLGSQLPPLERNKPAVWINSVPIAEHQDDSCLFKPHFAILAVSCQMYAEASSVFYEDTWFGVNYHITYRIGNAQDLGPAVDLRRVRRLIISINDDLAWGLRSDTLASAILAVLEFYASHTASLAYLGINLCFMEYSYWGRGYRVVSETFESPEIRQVLKTYTVRDEISIRLVHYRDDIALADTVERWSLSITEPEDMVIFKHKVSYSMAGQPVYCSVDWSVVRRKKTPLAAWKFSANKIHLPVAGKIVDSTEKVVDLDYDDEDTAEDSSEEDPDGQDEEEYDDEEDEQDESDDSRSDDENSEGNGEDLNVVADVAEEE